MSRSILILHGIDAWDRIRGPKRLAARAMGQVLCVSNYTKESFTSQVPGYSASRVHLFPNTLGESWIVPAEKASNTAPPDEEFHLLSVARLSESERDKGIQDILKSLGILKNEIAFRYTIIGEGDYRAALETYAQQLGIGDRVKFLGAVSDATLQNAYSKAHIFVLPSRKEGFGIVFLEAMRFGLPVLAAAEKGAVDVVIDGENGFLVPYGDIERIVSHIRFAARNRAALVSMGQNGRALVVPGGKFSFSEFRERTRKLFF